MQNRKFCNTINYADHIYRRGRRKHCGMSPKSKSKIYYLVIGLLCMALVLAAAISYSVFFDNHIFSESKEHLTEVYNQVNTTFLQTVEHNRNMLQGWEGYLDKWSDDRANESKKEESTKDALRFMKEQKATCGFSYFLFIDKETAMCKPLGLDEYQEGGEIPVTNAAKLELRRNLATVLNDGKGGVVGNIEGIEGRFIFITVALSAPDEKDEYQGFKYDTIGICFNEDQMQSLLNVTVYGKTGIAYIVLPDGSTVLQSQNSEQISFVEGNGDFLGFLEKECALKKNAKIETIKKDWNPAQLDEEGKAQSSDTILFAWRGEEYYLTYTPVGFGQWMLLGIAPSGEVNHHMNAFRAATIGVMAAIFVLIAAAITWVLIVYSRQRLKAKDLEVKTREGMLDLFTSNTNDVCIMFSAKNFEGVYISGNVERVFGIKAEEIRTDVRAVLKAAIQKHGAFTAEGLKNLPKGQNWQYDMQMQNLVTHDIYWYRFSLYHVDFKDEDDFVMMFSDRTEERRMSSDLEAALDMAKAANAAKSNFLSNMSHDIRTPMNAIIGYSTLLAKDADDGEKVRAYIRKITYSSQHLLSLINDILDMSKIESGKTTLQIEEFNLSAFIEELFSIVGPQFKAKNQIFEAHTKGKLPERVMGDKMRLNQIMLNLLSNAMKYTPVDGKIVMTVEGSKSKIHKHTHLRISVQDNGIGMSKEFVKEIFDPFARESKEKTRSIQGTGLGMTITKNIVDLMGGTIFVESEEGKGSTFTVQFDLAIVDKNAADDKDFWSRYNVTRVLTVDDEEDICLDIQTLMDGTGVKIDYALSGKQAVEMASVANEKEESYHIILLDWKMPDMDGVETAKRIRKVVGKDVPIMVLTSYSFDDIEEEARSAGIDYFLSKPFFVSNFRTAIESIRGEKKEEKLVEMSGRSLEGLKVLAAEDNEINAEILTELLDLEKVNCEIAENGKIALEKFLAAEKGRYDMIFMDIQMPVMNGYEAAEAIRASDHPEAKTIPIIAMTANAFDVDIKAALDAGMNAHVAKPLDMAKLKETIKQIRNERGNHNG